MDTSLDTSATRSERRLAGGLFLLGCLFGIGGGALYSDRNNGGSEVLPDSFLWERGLIAAAAVTILLGFVLLAVALRAAGERLFSMIGLSALTLGTALTLCAEWLIVSGRVGDAQAGMEWRLLTWGLVALIFVGQATYGVALLRAALLPRWIGWSLISWNLGALAVVAVVVLGAHGAYYPGLFYLGPLLLGAVLLLRPAGAVRAVTS